MPLILLKALSYPAFLFILLCSYALKFLGLRILYICGTLFGLLFFMFGFRKKVIQSNLELAFQKEKTEVERDELLRSIYQNTALIFLSILRNFSLSSNEIRKELLLSQEGKEKIDRSLAKGRGAIIISAHISNWELFAMGMTTIGFPISVVVKKMNNPLSQWLIERQRTRTGIEVIYSGGTLKTMKQHLKRGRVIGFMVDQNTTGKKGIRANFFGTPASCIRGLANLAKETNVPILPACAFRRPDGKHEVFIADELSYLEAPHLTGEEKALREEWLNTQQYQDAIEKLIRQHPEQWLWIHRRWKAKRDPLQFETAHLENTPSLS